MYRVFLSGAATIALMSSPALAGEEVIYEPAPGWVQVATVDAAGDEQGEVFRLYEQQARLEKGKLWVYSDQAIALTSPQSLTQFGTLTAQWLPDKGELIIHRVELIRGSEVIDVLAGGAKFEVLRREQQLEQRMLNGLLTASLSLPGAKIGDTVRLAYSMTRSDQALGDEVEESVFLPTKPLPLKKGSVTISWPETLDVKFALAGEKAALTPVTKDGYRFLSLNLPREEADETPYDAPFRYKLPAILQASTFADYGEVSRIMSPHYTTQDSIKDGDPVALETDKIMARTTDSLERAALATRLVQDEISYLLNGLNGGNYIPQEVSLTWEKRYGDCKAKTMLLLSMLRRMGIDAEPILVLSNGGDALTEMLPAPGNFDHILVKANISGIDYFLDGTSAGTRLSNIANVPRFEYALPLGPDGTELIALPQRPNAVPDQKVELILDQTAGLSLPALYDVTLRLTGGAADGWKTMHSQSDDDTREKTAQYAVTNYLGQHQMYDYSIVFDEENALVTIKAKGILTTPWQQDQGRYKLDPPLLLASSFNFSPDRARSTWREIPVKVQGPNYQDQSLTLLLPKDGGEFKLEGDLRLQTEIGGYQLSYTADLQPDRLTMTNSARTYQLEIPADEISDARRSASRLKRTLPVVLAPDTVIRNWDYHGAAAKRLNPLIKAYNALAAKADKDDTSPWINRANFLQGIGDFAGALEDYNSALKVETDPQLLYARSRVKLALGDLEGALTDLTDAEELTGDASTYPDRAELLGQLGRADEAVALASEYADFANDEHVARMVEASAIGWTADKKKGLDILQEEADYRPQDGTLLNSLCWYAGIWDLVSEDTVNSCTQAVENSTSSANVLDSRAMNYFRLGKYDQAIADYDAALFSSPTLYAARYMRGVVKLEMGENSGRKDIEDALRMSPDIGPTYAKYGIKPKL